MTQEIDEIIKEEIKYITNFFCEKEEQIIRDFYNAVGLELDGPEQSISEMEYEFKSMGYEIKIQYFSTLHRRVSLMNTELDISVLSRDIIVNLVS